MNEKNYFPLSGLRVCIDNAENGEISGVFYSPMDEKRYEVHGIEEFVLAAEEVFNEHGYPQAYMIGRTFLKKRKDAGRYMGKPKAVCSDACILSHTGNLATCDVVVESRRKASWQGYVRDADGNEVGDFHGILDMADIIKRIIEG